MSNDTQTLSENILITSEKLLQLREHLGLNQGQMAAKLGVSRNYVSMIEQGREPSKVVLMLLDDLWNRSGPESETASESPYSVGTLNPSENTLSEPVAVSYGRGLLKQARLALGLTPAEVAGAVGYSLAVYQQIEEGTSQPSESMARRLAGLLKVPVESLLAGADQPPDRGTHFGTVGTVPDLVSTGGHRAKFVPLLSVAQCGAMHAYNDSAYDHTGFVAHDPADFRAFAVHLAGDSMRPVIEPGDIAIIYPSKPPRQGGMVLARLRDDLGGDVMCKLYQSAKDNITLSSYNPAYPPITHHRADFAWVYPVASLTKILL